MKSIFVKAYMNKNLGDDLFISILLKRYPKTIFYLKAPSQYKKIFKDYKNIVILENEKKRFWSRLKGLIYRRVSVKLYKGHLKKNLNLEIPDIVLKCDAFVSIGGSIFMQTRKLPVYMDIEYYKLINRYFEKKFFLGCNFGPYKTSDYLEQYGQIFSEATDVCFREQKSTELFQKLCNVRTAPDIVFSMPSLRKNIDLNTVGFTIISTRGMLNEESYITKYVELINYYLKKHISRVYLFSFCKAEGDEDIIEKIYFHLDDKQKIEKIFYNENLNAFMDIYSSVETMYCGRFHSMILSMLHGQKIYPVIYSEKMTNVLKDINYQGKIIQLSKFDEINTELCYTQPPLNKYNINNERILAQSQFETLDNFINK